MNLFSLDADKIDWEELREQKLLLLELLDQEEHRNPEIAFKVSGLVNFLDYIQDTVVDDAGIMTEEEVFGKLGEEEPEESNGSH